MNEQIAETSAYYRRNTDGIVATATASGIFPNWLGVRERWLFVSPHDDDSIIGAGLTMLAARDENIHVHIAITTDGSMGYCDIAQKPTIADIRQRETEKATAILGVPPENLHFLGFPDGNLENLSGRRQARNGDPAVLQGYTGLQNSYTKILRDIDPTRVFIPTGADLHPDHQTAAREFLISLFHAQGAIWPELGAPSTRVPEVYEYATYCDFTAPPQIKIQMPKSRLALKLDAIAAFASQKQITILIDQIRQGGPVEYLREMQFHFYSPRVYENLF